MKMGSEIPPVDRKCRKGLAKYQRFPPISNQLKIKLFFVYKKYLFVSHCVKRSLIPPAE